MTQLYSTCENLTDIITNLFNIAATKPDIYRSIYNIAIKYKELCEDNSYKYTMHNLGFVRMCDLAAMQDYEIGTWDEVRLYTGFDFFLEDVHKYSKTEVTEDFPVNVSKNKYCEDYGYLDLLKLYKHIEDTTLLLGFDKLVMSFHFDYESCDSIDFLKNVRLISVVEAIFPEEEE